MAPKKDANGEAGEGGKFVWEGANDTKLLLLTQGRFVKPDEYEQLASAFGTSIGSIRNRISALRVKQRNMYEQRGWTVPEGGAGHSAKKPKATPKTNATPRKRAADGESEDAPETPSKRPRVVRKKQKDGELEERKDSGTEEGESEMGNVKEEPVDEV